MILIDTNVVSGAMKPEPHPSVRDWLDAQAAETLFLSSVTIAGLMFGIGSRAPTAHWSCWTRGSRWSHHAGHTMTDTSRLPQQAPASATEHVVDRTAAQSVKGSPGSG